MESQPRPLGEARTESVEREAVPQLELKLVKPDDTEFAHAEQVEATIFKKAFNNSPELMKEEYDPYRQASEFLLVVDRGSNEVAGVMRLIHNSEAGLKSLNDLAGEPWHQDPQAVLERTGLHLDLDSTIDIATVGVDEGYRVQDGQDGRVSMALYHGLSKYSEARGITHWVTILDDKVLAVLQAAFEPFHNYDGVGSGSYLDSPSSTPVWADYRQTINTLEKTNPQLHDFVVKGKGLNELVSIPEKL